MQVFSCPGQMRSRLQVRGSAADYWSSAAYLLLFTAAASSSVSAVTETEERGDTEHLMIRFNFKIIPTGNRLL